MFRMFASYTLVQYNEVDGQSRDHPGFTNPNIIRWSKPTRMFPETLPNPSANQLIENQCQPDDNGNGINQQNHNQDHDGNQSRRGNHSNKRFHLDSNIMNNSTQSGCDQGVIISIRRCYFILD